MSIISVAQRGKEHRMGYPHDHFLDFPTKAPYPANAMMIDDLQTNISRERMR
jgi:hypothetical protein